MKDWTDREGSRAKVFNTAYIQKKKGQTKPQMNYKMSILPFSFPVSIEWACRQLLQRATD